MNLDLWWNGRIDNTLRGPAEFKTRSTKTLVQDPENIKNDRTSRCPLDRFPPLQTKYASLLGNVNLKKVLYIRFIQMGARLWWRVDIIQPNP